jgi:molybdopterin synthase catalytic subunit
MPSSGLKEVVPIWKKEHYRDGSTWIGSEAEYRRQLAADEPQP